MDNIPFTVAIIKPDTCLSREKVNFFLENYITTKKGLKNYITHRRRGIHHKKHNSEINNKRRSFKLILQALKKRLF